ncbi:Xaa-Pro peptidase family protein [Breoghania sp.]|uniref:M24 family metallopeptidase n=1 Tax=Breoghania sp. TaxID=2065378 RepID=UPI00260D6108|nr:Xaa-Pro peptidase family protein [Breoghania sp.]MDJ0932751.1 Xaa-Pro peptidase family protein [Breoghania sp.]
MLFAKEEMEARADKARVMMKDVGVDLLIADSGELLAWLTGYTVSETMYRACFLPLDGAPFMVLRTLDADNARSSCWFDDISSFADWESPHETMARVLKQKGFGNARIGVDANSYGFSVLMESRSEVLLPEVTFINMGEFGHVLREQKSPAEIALLANAATIAEHDGMTTRYAAAVAAQTFLRESADTGEVGPIVKSVGEHAFLHGAFATDKLGPGDVLHVELIPKVANYSARMMRPIIIGTPSTRQRYVADRLISLQDEQIAAMRTGALASDVDAIVRKPMLAEGLRKDYPNVTAYTLGLVTRTRRTSDFSRAFLPNADWALKGRG